jgi:dihydropteroate synthase
LYYFSEKIALARSYAINDLVIDPGFGFGKTQEHNFKILSELELFKNIELPLLIGLSRKSMIYKTLQTNAKDALNGTTSLNTISLLKGANILRVHDVKEAIECIKLTNNLPS